MSYTHTLLATKKGGQHSVGRIKFLVDFEDILASYAQDLNNFDKETLIMHLITSVKLHLDFTLI